MVEEYREMVVLLQKATDCRGKYFPPLRTIDRSASETVDLIVKIKHKGLRFVRASKYEKPGDVAVLLSLGTCDRICCAAVAHGVMLLAGSEHIENCG